MTEVGAAAAALIKPHLASVFESMLGATHVTEKDVEIGGVPGLESSYQYSTKLGAVHASQLEVLPKPNFVCDVTVSAGPDVPTGAIVSTAAATAQFS